MNAFSVASNADRVVYAEAGDGEDVVRVPGAAEELDERLLVRGDVVVREPVLKFLLARCAQRLNPVTGFPAAEYQLSVKLIRIHNQLTLRLFHILCPIPNLFFNLEFKGD